MKKYINFINESMGKETKKEDSGGVDILMKILGSDTEVEDTDNSKIDNSKIKEEYINDIKKEKNLLIINQKLKEFRIQFGKKEANNLSRELKLGIGFE